MDRVLIALRAQADRARGVTIGSVRILAGLLWLANLHWKVPGEFGESTNSGLYKYAAAGANNAPLAPYRWLLREVVLPNFQAFGWFTLLSETVVAALLIIGYRTRLVAFAGALMAIPIGLSVLYYPRADEWAWSYLLMIGLHLLLWAVPAGDHLGIDGVLRGSDARFADYWHLHDRHRCPRTLRRAVDRLCWRCGRTPGQRQWLS